MSLFEINKILGAVLGTSLILVAVHIAAGAIFSPPVPAKPGYVIAVKAKPPGAKPAAAPAEQPIENLLASASAERGAQVAKVCEVCHNVQKGQGTKIGPDLYGVVGGKAASAAGFNYSVALKAHDGTWTFDALDKWLTNPSADVPGTAMTFAGLPSGKQRADLIAYLNTLSDHPLPLPTAKTEGGAPAAQPAKAPAAAPAEQPIENLLASASVERGAQSAKLCEICHNVQKGQGSKIGPDLYGVVGRKVASAAGFNYSAALKAHDGTWTFDTLDKWLTKPSAYVPGTTMTFAGLPHSKQRADVIAYLNTLSDHPLPLPTAKTEGGTPAGPPAKAQ